MKGKVLSAAEILLGQSFLERQEKAERYIKHEFQDFAVRLAEELGDRSHKGIYMKLAKTQPRYLLERALAEVKLAADYNKGKLFMWKLAQLRQDLRLKKANSDYSWDFVAKRTQSLLSKTAKLSVRKAQADYLDKHEQLSSLLELLHVRLTKAENSKQKALIFDTYAGFLFKDLTKLGYKVSGYEPSPIAKLVNEKQPDLKLKSGMVTNGKFGKTGVDLVWAGGGWKYVPIANEKDAIGYIKNILRPNGVCVIETRLESETSESWHEFNSTIADEYFHYYYKKCNNLEQLIADFAEQGLAHLLTCEGYLVFTAG